LNDKAYPIGFPFESLFESPRLDFPQAIPNSLLIRIATLYFVQNNNLHEVVIYLPLFLVNPPRFFFVHWLLVWRVGVCLTWGWDYWNFILVFVDFAGCFITLFWYTGFLFMIWGMVFFSFSHMLLIYIIDLVNHK
jgi:hypothetical protein